eukprot:3126055-Amphidinium_carterae.1
MGPAAAPAQRTANTLTSVKLPACSDVAAPSSISGSRASQGFVNSKAAAWSAIALSSADGDVVRLRPRRPGEASSPMVDVIAVTVKRFPVRANGLACLACHTEHEDHEQWADKPTQVESSPTAKSERPEVIYASMPLTRRAPRHLRPSLVPHHTHGLVGSDHAALGSCLQERCCSCTNRPRSLCPDECQTSNSHQGGDPHNANVCPNVISVKTKRSGAQAPRRRESSLLANSDRGLDCRHQANCRRRRISRLHGHPGRLTR